MKNDLDNEKFIKNALSTGKHKESLKEAIKRLGGKVSDLSNSTNADYRKAWNWLNRDLSGLAPEYVIVVEEMTGISRVDLRPDIFTEYKDRKAVNDENFNE